MTHCGFCLVAETGCHATAFEGLAGRDEPVNRATQLRATLERTKSRLAYAQQEVERARRNHDASDPCTARSLRKLEMDVQCAEIDLSLIQRQLDDLMD